MPTRTRVSTTDGLKARHLARPNSRPPSSNGNGAVTVTSEDVAGKGETKAKKASDGDVSKAVALSVVDYTLVLGLVFVGCCSSVHVISTAMFTIQLELFVHRNVWSYEQLLKMDAHVGEDALVRILAS